MKKFSLHALAVKYARLRNTYLIGYRLIENDELYGAISFVLATGQKLSFTEHNFRTLGIGMHDEDQVVAEEDEQVNEPIKTRAKTSKKGARLEKVLPK
jgi:hypothetical protein